MRNKIFTKIIITTLLVTFLTFNVGRVTRVSAVATTTAAVIAFDCLVALGVIGITYTCLTNADVYIPDFSSADARDDYFHSVGQKLVQYPAAKETYLELYEHALHEPVHGILDSVFTWTSEKLKAWAQDFSTVDTLQNIYSYDYTVDTSSIAQNGFAYSGTFRVVPDMFRWSATNWQPISDIPSITMADGYRVATQGQGFYYFVSTSVSQTLTLRNYLKSDGRYKVQRLNGDTWVDYTTGFNCGVRQVNSYTQYRLGVYGDGSQGYTEYTYSPGTITNDSTYPLLPDVVIYDSVNDRDLPMVEVSPDRFQLSPQWQNQNEDPKFPVIPYVQLPWNPNWVSPSTGVTGGGDWGVDLSDLLDKIEDLAGGMITLGDIAYLINLFKSSLAGTSDDVYYIAYDDSENNYYDYYSITNYGDETYYTYNIDVSHADEHLPVDLNTIQKYTDNTYLTQIKESAIAGSSIIRDFAVFWYDVDPEITYIVFGCCILVLIGAFTGKLGHS